ncbi:MAG: rRNA methyltransferase, partial [Bacteroidetes bacterium]|nr:rRNA methyltransferase [Bacteroidota bacterium]
MQLPADFAASIKKSLGTAYPAFLDALDEEPPVSIRLNPHKKIPDTGTAVPWCSTGRYLPSRPVFTTDPFLHAGAYYVQEASSMFLEQAIVQHVDRSRPLRVLDVSAAPGGKSTHLLSLISDDSLLFANEVIRSRASILSENIQKWGYPNVVVTSNDPQDFGRLPGFFDVIVLDAPCSGEGLF